MNKQEIEKALTWVKEVINHQVFERATYEDTYGTGDLSEERKEVYEEMDNNINLFKTIQCALTQQLNNGWIPTSERLPQLPDGKSFMPLNATILAPSGLRNTVQMTWELKRGKPTWCYLGETSDWNVIAWQSLPEPYKE